MYSAPLYHNPLIVHVSPHQHPDNVMTLTKEYHALSEVTVTSPAQEHTQSKSGQHDGETGKVKS